MLLGLSVPFSATLCWSQPLLIVHLFYHNSSATAYNITNTINIITYISSI